MVISDGCYAHTVDEVLEICKNDSYGHSAAPLRIYCKAKTCHFGVFKGAFRVELEIEAMKQLSSSWFIKRQHLVFQFLRVWARLRRHGKA